MGFDKRTLQNQLNDVLCRDRHAIKQQIRSLPPADHDAFKKRLEKIRNRIETSRNAVQKRQKSFGIPDYPKNLPITSKKDEIVEAISNNQVVIITGETGSGKTTQIPKMCLEAGRGIHGKIACTQPRRIAATSLCRQVAHEMNTEVGELVGFKIRFFEKVSDSTLIQFVTDGLLLAEIQGDRFLNDYDTIVIDEAHERTLNIDFLMGYLKQLLLRRPELKLVVTSATIDVEKFSKAFPLVWREEQSQGFMADPQKDYRNNSPLPAPIISVSGRMYPVEVRYHPIDEQMEEEGDITMIDLVQDATEEILTETMQGDILIFMSGIQEIREAMDRLTYLEKEGFTVLPLFGRLTNEEQNRIFKKTDKRKIILSTNIAETSITVPGIHYVVDTGRARISQYYSRSGTQGLPIKAISQSSADQRKGRCGRVQDGVCIRLYSEEDYLNRPKYSTPEIQRSNLSEVILRLLDLKLGDIDTFPFIDPPESSQVRAGFRDLRELGALNQEKRLTPVGKDLASLPVDPRTARMILQADREKALYPVLIIASAISCQDPRERPEDKKTQADQKHAQFKSRESDLMTMLNLWEAYHSTLEELKSQGKMRKFCKANFLSYNRIREWRDIYGQLAAIAQEKGWQVEKPDNWDYTAIHRSILAGYLSHIARHKEKKIYNGTQNRTFRLFPGSDQYQSRHAWIVAIELIETSKLFAHRVARIDPDWLEALAGNLCSKSWSEPHWDKENQRVTAYEKVTLFGFTLVEKRRVFYGKIDREESNRIFIREALVEGKFESDLPFWKHNCKLIREIRKEEDKRRSRSLLVDDIEIERFYLKQIQGVACLNDLKKLIKKHSGDSFLFMKREDLLRNEPGDLSLLYPTAMQIGNRKVTLSYHFEPDHPKDGVTVHLPESLLSSVRQEDFEYLVPGLLKEKIYWLMKNLPKELRRKIVPIPEKAEKIWDDMVSYEYSTASEERPDTLEKDFYRDLSEKLFRHTRVHIPPEIWDNSSLPEYLKMNFAIRNPKTKKTTHTRNLKELTEKPDNREDEWEKLIQPLERWPVMNWDFGSLLEKVKLSGDSDIPIWGYKSLTVKEGQLGITVYKSYEEAEDNAIKGVARLLEAELGKELAWLFEELRFPPETLSRLQNIWNSRHHVSLEALQKKFDSKKAPMQRKYHEEMQTKAFKMAKEGLCGFNGELITNQKQFESRIRSIKTRLDTLGMQVVDWINQSLENYHIVKQLLYRKKASLESGFVKEMENELGSFFSKDCLSEIPLEQWRHCPRLLKCYEKRIQRYLENPEREEQLMEQLFSVEDDLKDHIGRDRKSQRKQWAEKHLKWMLEEFKISLFAQDLSTAFPVSPKRIRSFINEHLNN